MRIIEEVIAEFEGRIEALLNNYNIEYEKDGKYSDISRYKLRSNKNYITFTISFTASDACYHCSLVSTEEDNYAKSSVTVENIETFIWHLIDFFQLNKHLFG